MELEGIRGILGQYLNRSHDELVKLALRSLSPVLGEIQDVGFQEDQAVVILLMLIRSTISADDEFTEKEERFARDVFTGKLSFVVDYLKSFDAEKEKEVRNSCATIFMMLSPNGQAEVLNLVSTFIAADGKIDEAEFDYIARMLQV